MSFPKATSNVARHVGRTIASHKTGTENRGIRKRKAAGQIQFRSGGYGYALIVIKKEEGISWRLKIRQSTGDATPALRRFVGESVMHA